MNKSLNVFTLAVNGSGIAYFLDNIQNIIGIIVGVLSLISIALNLYFNISSKIKEARKDGIITKDEQDQIIKDVVEGGKQLIDTAKKIVDGNNDSKEDK